MSDLICEECGEGEVILLGGPTGPVSRCRECGAIESTNPENPENVKYILKWKGETIDETNSQANAKYLQAEYNLAYKGGVSIIKTQSS